MNKYSGTVLSGVLTILLIVITLSGCSTPEAETVTQTSTGWKTSTVTATVEVPTTVTITSNSTITVTSAVSAPSTTKTSTSSTSSTTSTTIDPYSNYHGYLLDGYPEDIWPLYGELAIDSCSLDVQFPSYNQTGHYVNSYTVVYITNKTKQEIAEYYTSLLQTQEESGFYDALGTIDGYELNARWDEWGANNIVYLSVLLPNTLNITENPLHADFPEILLNFYEIDDLWNEYFVCTSNPGGTVIASKLFSHSGTKAEALEFYRSLYSDTQDYKETVTQEYSGESVQLSGVIDELSFIITIGVWGDPSMIQIYYQKPQQ